MNKRNGRSIKICRDEISLSGTFLKVVSAIGKNKTKQMNKHQQKIKKRRLVNKYLEDR